MKDLIARLEAAEVGSRELDALICCSLRDGPDWANDPYYPLGSHGLYSVGRGGPGLTSECYTNSLDAALALAERVLPGCLISVGTNIFGHAPIGVAEVFTQQGGSDATHDGHGERLGNTPALALCVAILRAKLAEEPTKG